MSAPRGPVKDAGPIEKFKPTTGAIVGMVGLVPLVALLVYVVVAVHSVTGVRVGLALAFCAVLVWATQLRPRATAYPGFLRIKNALLDTDIPYGVIDDVSVRQTLNVWVGDVRYICIGIGRRSKSLMSGRRRSAAAVLGMERLHEYAEQAKHPALDQTSTTYETFVVTRIEDLVDRAKRQLRGAQPTGTVRRRIAVPEAAALVVLGVAFLGSLFV